MWGPNGEILDYAAKQWSGLFSHYYNPRWKLFFDTLEANLKEGKNTFDEATFRKDFLDQIGEPFTRDGNKQIYFQLHSGPRLNLI